VTNPVRATHDDSPARLAANPASRSVADLEMVLLRALCQTPASAARDELLLSLHRHEWGDPERRLIFQTLTELPRCSGDELRHALPAHLTRAGFPDTDVNPFFAPLQPSGGSLPSFAEELCGMLAPSARPNRKSKLKSATKAIARRRTRG
jgi:hypothetical protein